MFEGVDRIAVLLYVVLVAIGFVNILSASYNDDAEIFSFSQQYIKQLMWISVAFSVALIILLLDSRYYHMYAYYAYAGGILMLIAVLLFGREVNGAKAWFEFGSVRVQPAEFVKIATALMMARVMSDYSFSMNRVRDLVKVALVIFIPIIIIIIQNDTGSALVLCSFLFVCVREGLTKYLSFPAIFTVLLFISSFIFHRSF